MAENTALDVLVKFPALWTVFGGLITGVLAYVLSLQVIKQTQISQDRLVSNLEKELEVMTSDRDEWKDKAHTAKNDFVACQLQVRTLESRPDLGELKAMLSAHNDGVQAVAHSLQGHIESDAKMFGAIETALSAIPAALREQAKAFNERQAQVFKHLRIKPKPIHATNS